MKQLPYVDEHAITGDADRDATWPAVLRVLCRDPRDPSTVPFGFVLEEAAPQRRLSLIGRHLFAAYRLAFELEPDPGGTRVRAITWADFPGLRGTLYRALVIGSGGHRVVVRRMLRRIAAQAS
jgi:hypothetical protein